MEKRERYKGMEDRVRNEEIKEINFRETKPAHMLTITSR